MLLDEGSAEAARLLAATEPPSVGAPNNESPASGSGAGGVVAPDPVLQRKLTSPVLLRGLGSAGEAVRESEGDALARGLVATQETS